MEPILDPAIGELSKTLANFSIVEPGISSLDTNESVPNDEMYAESIGIDVKLSWKGILVVLLDLICQSILMKIWRLRMR